jgi:hypothetical protein
MYRILKPGKHVVNLEMYVQRAPSRFTDDFERAGFVTRDVRVLNRHFARTERFLQAEGRPLWLVALTGQLSAGYRFWFDSIPPEDHCIRDYLFIWQKP